MKIFPILAPKKAIRRLALLAIISWIPSAYSNVFVHTTDSENVSGHMTRLTHAAIEGNAEKLLFVTPRFGKYNPHTVGVWYETETDKWTIYNEDRTFLPEGTQFNILALDPDTPQAFTHTATAQNTQEYYTFIDHPASDYNPNAVVIITPNWSEAYVPGPLGVWFDGERWSIYRQDKKDLSVGTRFNVLVLQPGPNEIKGSEALTITTYTHKAGGQNTRGHITNLVRSDPNEVLSITHNWDTDGPYNQGVPGVWFNGENWTVLNQGREPIEAGSRFNIIATMASAPTTPVAPPASKADDTVREAGWLKITHQGSFDANCILFFSIDGGQHNGDTGMISNGDTRVFRIPENAEEIRLVIESSQDGISRRSVNMNFEEAPNSTFAIQGTFARHWLDKTQ
ncbi:MAG: hypothetical protein AAF212_07570 [Verrucomicrobiota bacterium]